MLLTYTLPLFILLLSLPHAHAGGPNELQLTPGQGLPPLPELNLTTALLYTKTQEFIQNLKTPVNANRRSVCHPQSHKRWVDECRDEGEPSMDNNPTFGAGYYGAISSVHPSDGGLNAVIRGWKQQNVADKARSSWCLHVADAVRSMAAPKMEDRMGCKRFVEGGSHNGALVLTRLIAAHGNGELIIEARRDKSVENRRLE
ncbi:hypothetical protein B0T16DRAFT_395324 [Cercophora newfieldiana]|uniref:Uncharacterized protein n=1 Tax=Cercophora newfieldiana TaxID=92897 RepID=A0AA39XSW3_9PEZI|nr:hypothetical protein B0T16DRAFT_395324 [Cercophora newfieldiana]